MLMEYMTCQVTIGLMDYLNGMAAQGWRFVATTGNNTFILERPRASGSKQILAEVEEEVESSPKYKFYFDEEQRLHPAKEISGEELFSILAGKQYDAENFSIYCEGSFGGQPDEKIEEGSVCDLTSHRRFYSVPAAKFGLGTLDRCIHVMSAISPRQALCGATGVNTIKVKTTKDGGPTDCNLCLAEVRAVLAHARQILG
jgi:hypothetical protein